MKTLSRILLLLAFISCEKTADYRDTYIGNYRCFFLKTLIVWNSETDESHVDTLYFSNDTIIQIQKAENTNEIVFLDWNLRININGVIDSGYCSSQGGGCMDCRYYPLLFSCDSISYFSQCGGHGSFYIYDLSGIKIR